MWAMMQKFRMIDAGVSPGFGAVEADTDDFRVRRARRVAPFSHVHLPGPNPRSGQDEQVPSTPVYPVPPLNSARRLEWAHLPPMLRADVEARCGARVVDAHSVEAGFTPGMATVLRCEDGSRHFVKAASHRAQRAFAASYVEEVRHLRAVPATAHVPRLLWAMNDSEWIVFSTEHVDARPVTRPWTRADLEVCLDALAEHAERTGRHLSARREKSVELNPGVQHAAHRERPSSGSEVSSLMRQKR